MCPVTLLEIAQRYETDKGDHPYYLACYEEILPPRDAPVRMLELGINRGGSLQMWRDYYPAGTIVGLDLMPVDVADDTGRIHVYQGGQDDRALLDRIRQECAPDGFDVVIDDASHVGHYTRVSFWHLFEHHLKPGGTYVIEDWATGYWRDWPDGRLYDEPRPLTPRFQPALARLRASPIARLPGAARLLYRLDQLAMPKRFPSHDAGMVGMIKELVDEICAAERTHPDHGRPPLRLPRIAELRYTRGQVFVRKQA